jgi:hypothetical protein
MRDISRSRGPSAVTSRTRPADSTPWRRRASVRWSGLATSGRSVVTSRLYQGWHVTGSQCRLRAKSQSHSVQKWVSADAFRNFHRIERLSIIKRMMLSRRVPRRALIHAAVVVPMLAAGARQSRGDIPDGAGRLQTIAPGRDSQTADLGTPKSNYAPTSHQIGAAKAFCCTSMGWARIRPESWAA